MISLNIFDFFLFFVPGFLLLVIKMQLVEYGKRKNDIETIFWSIANSGILMIFVQASIMIINHIFGNKIGINLFTSASLIMNDYKQALAVFLLYLCWIILLLSLNTIQINNFKNAIMFYFQKFFITDAYNDNEEPWDKAFREERKEDEGLILSIIKPSGERNVGRLKYYTGSFDSDSECQIVLHNMDLFNWLKRKGKLDKALGEPEKTLHMLTCGYQIDFYNEKEVDKKIHEIINEEANSSEGASFCKEE